MFRIESTPPGAEVYVDGEFVGTTPIAEHSLATGKHEVELRKKGFAHWKRQLSVLAGARATVAAESRPFVRPLEPARRGPGAGLVQVLDGSSVLFRVFVFAS